MHEPGLHDHKNVKRKIIALAITLEIINNNMNRVSIYTTQMGDWVSKRPFRKQYNQVDNLVAKTRRDKFTNPK